MLPKGYDPKNYNGMIWWNEENEQMKELWGTQKDYDKHVSSGGNWDEYVTKRQIMSMNNNNQNDYSAHGKTR